MGTHLPFSFIVIGVAIAAACVFVGARRQLLRIIGVVVVPDNTVGLVTKKFVLWGEHKDLPPGRIVALRGEAGDQVDTLASGVHYGLWPWQYSIQFAPLTIVPVGHIGVVESRDGAPLDNGQVVGRFVPCDMYQDARAFLEGNGQRGAQGAVVPEGSYRINTLLFQIKLEPMVTIM